MYSILVSLVISNPKSNGTDSNRKGFGMPRLLQNVRRVNWDE